MKITVYVPDDLAARLPVLPPRSVSRTCQEALRRAVEQAELERADAIVTAFEED